MGASAAATLSNTTVAGPTSEAICSTRSSPPAKRCTKTASACCKRLGPDLTARGLLYFQPVQGVLLSVATRVRIEQASTIYAAFFPISAAAASRASIFIPPVLRVLALRPCLHRFVFHTCLHHSSFPPSVAARTFACDDAAPACSAGYGDRRCRVFCPGHRIVENGEPLG